MVGSGSGMAGSSRSNNSPRPVRPIIVLNRGERVARPKSKQVRFESSPPTRHLRRTVDSRRWTVSRVFSRSLCRSLEEHIESHHQQQSYLSLSKLFLNQLGLWDKDIRFRNPTAENFIKVRVMKVLGCQRGSDNNAIIYTQEVRVAETAKEQGKRLREFVAFSDLGQLLHQLIKTGDYFAFWESGDGGRCADTRVTILNMDSYTEKSNFIVYRHNQQHSFLVSDEMSANFITAFVQQLDRDVCVQSFASKEVFFKDCRRIRDKN